MAEATAASFLRIQPITLTEEEIDERKHLIAKGELPPDYLKRYVKAVEDNVFGHDHKKDRKGTPIEQGLGAPGHETANHFAAILKYEGKEAHAIAVADLHKRNPTLAEKLRLPKPKAA